ncbi:MAG: hypothetical protein ABI181_14050 [Mycobacteriaceae bacterium]
MSDIGVDEWNASGMGHHWPRPHGHPAADCRAAADRPGIDHRAV